MRFSLVLATVGRTDELRRFLAHLDTQTHREFELVVVDQNKDERLKPILEPYRGKFPILHLPSEQGLSRARNVGIEHARGDVIGFPALAATSMEQGRLTAYAAFVEPVPSLGDLVPIGHLHDPLRSATSATTKHS